MLNDVPFEMSFYTFRIRLLQSLLHNVSELLHFKERNVFILSVKENTLQLDKQPQIRISRTRIELYNKTLNNVKILFL